MGICYSIDGDHMMGYICCFSFKLNKRRNYINYDDYIYTQNPYIYKKKNPYVTSDQYNTTTKWLTYKDLFVLIYLYISG
jgi:hypothetical protein